MLASDPDFERTLDRWAKKTPGRVEATARREAYALPGSFHYQSLVDGVTETVGRAHARLRFDPAAREYRLFDDGSSNGTSIIRGGTTIAVPARDPRGVRVQSGDEVQVGRAVIRVMLGG